MTCRGYHFVYAIFSWPNADGNAWGIRLRHEGVGGIEDGHLCQTSLLSGESVSDVAKRNLPLLKNPFCLLPSSIARCGKSLNPKQCAALGL